MSSTTLTSLITSFVTSLITSLVLDEEELEFTNELLIVLLEMLYELEVELVSAVLEVKLFFQDGVVLFGGLSSGVSCLTSSAFFFRQGIELRPPGDRSLCLPLFDD